jgi:hypothetical protein
MRGAAGNHMNDVFAKTGRSALRLVMMLVLTISSVWAQSKNLAPEFTTRPVASRLVIVPSDIELFSLSAGGVREPKADWTEAASKHFASSLNAKSKLMGSDVVAMKETDLDDLSELSAVHGAVATSVFVHHMLSRGLPTKDGKLLWSLGDAVKPLRDKTGADYALFTWVRDSYATAERKVAMVAFAVLGVGIAGGTQIAYASLVDLKTGQIVWFNNLARGHGDLREEQPALETVEALLRSFPESK